MTHKEIAPEVDSNCRRYGHVLIGGDLYRIPRISLGTYGMQLRDALDKLRNVTDNQFEAFEEFFHIAMSRFYSNKTIDALIEDGNVGIEEIEAIIEVVSGGGDAAGQTDGMGADDPKKKSMAES